MGKYDNLSALDSSPVYGYVQVAGRYTSYHVFERESSEASFPENEESMEINLSRCEAEEAAAGVAAAEEEDSLSGMDFVTEPLSELPTEADSGLTSSISMDIGERNVNTACHECDYENSFNHTTFPFSLAAVDKAEYFGTLQSGYLGEITIPPYAFSSEHSEVSLDCNSLAKERVYKTRSRAPRKCRGLSKRTGEMIREDVYGQMSTSGESKSDDCSPLTRLKQRLRGLFVDEDCSGDYDGSAMHAPIPLHPVRYSVASTNRSCSSPRYSALVYYVDKGQRFQNWDCNAYSTVNLSPRPAKSHCRRHHRGGFRRRNKGSYRTSVEDEAVGVAAVAAEVGEAEAEEDSYSVEDCNVLLTRRRDWHHRSGGDSTNCVTEVNNCEYDVVTRTKTGAEDVSLYCRPCKGRAATKICRGQAWGGQCCDVYGAGCYCCGGHLIRLRDNCVQTSYRTRRRNQCVQCVVTTSQASDQGCQTPVTLRTVRCECLPRVSQAPCKGCRPCSTCFIPRNCSAAIPQWNRTVSGKITTFCDDDDDDDDDNCHSNNSLCLKHEKDGNNGSGSVSHCEVDVEDEPASAQNYTEDTDTSSLASSLLRLGLAAAGTTKRIKRECLMKN